MIASHDVATALLDALSAHRLSALLGFLCAPPRVALLLEQPPDRVVRDLESLRDQRVGELARPRVRSCHLEVGPSDRRRAAGPG